MADESVTKVFHACSQDMEVMLHTVGVLPRPIFDTQVAAAFWASASRFVWRACSDVLRRIAAQDRVTDRLVAPPLTR